MSTITKIGTALALAKIGAALALVVGLGACTTPAVIADASDSAVWVEGDPWLTEDKAYLAEAERGCSQYGKSAARLSSWENVAIRRVLFACK
jgi:hypothetical protein